MKKLLKYHFKLLSLTIILLCSACGVKEDIEKSVNKDKNHVAERKISSTFLDKYQAPIEQIEFFKKYYALNVIPASKLGTREVQPLLTVAEELASSVTSINGWVCEVEDYHKLEETTYSMKCALDGNSSDVLRLSSIQFISQTIYYKGDVVKVSGPFKAQISIREFKSLGLEAEVIDNDKVKIELLSK
jgi:hypothetical protein